MDPTTHELRQLVQALQDHQSDVEPFLALHDEMTVVVNIAGRRVSGLERLRDAMEAALASPLADVTTRLEVDEVRLLRSDVAIISCTKHVVDGRPGGDGLPTRGALTYVAGRDAAGWRIALAQTTPGAGA